VTTATFDPIADESIRYATDPTLRHRTHLAATEAEPTSQLALLGS
jgi:hypothetical protein